MVWLKVFLSAALQVHFREDVSSHFSAFHVTIRYWFLRMLSDCCDTAPTRPMDFLDLIDDAFARIWVCSWFDISREDPSASCSVFHIFSRKACCRQWHPRLPDRLVFSGNLASLASENITLESLALSDMLSCLSYKFLLLSSVATSSPLAKIWPPNHCLLHTDTVNDSETVFNFKLWGTFLVSSHACCSRFHCVFNPQPLVLIEQKQIDFAKKEPRKLTGCLFPKIREAIRNWQIKLFHLNYQFQLTNSFFDENFVIIFKFCISQTTSTNSCMWTTTTRVACNKWNP